MLCFFILGNLFWSIIFIRPSREISWIIQRKYIFSTVVSLETRTHPIVLRVDLLKHDPFKKKSDSCCKYIKLKALSIMELIESHAHDVFPQHNSTFNLSQSKESQNSFIQCAYSYQQCIILYEQLTWNSLNFNWHKNNWHQSVNKPYTQSRVSNSVTFCPSLLQAKHFTYQIKKAGLVPGQPTYPPGGYRWQQWEERPGHRWAGREGPQILGSSSASWLCGVQEQPGRS